MALGPRLPLLIAILVVGTNLLQPMALAAGLDAGDKATLKEATRLYKQGRYEDAAKLLSELAVDHSEMTTLQRNLGACYYYLRRPEPALSNLRGYLAHKKTDITPDDKQEVERWIDEMEKLRAQNAAVPVAPPPSAEPLPGAQPPSPNLVTPIPPEAPPLPRPVQESAVSAAQQAGETSPGSGLRIAGMACGALGLASIGTAVYFYTRATSLSDKVTGANPASPSDYQAGKDAEKMQWVFYSVGAGALATGAVLYWLGNSQTSPGPVSLAPMLGPSTAGLSARGGF